MEKIIVEIKNENKKYPVFIGNEILPKLAGFIKEQHSDKKVVVVTDDIVKSLYENKINAELNGVEVNWFVNVKKKENTIILYNLGVLFFLGYFFYKAAKVYYLKFLTI